MTNTIQLSNRLDTPAKLAVAVATGCGYSGYDWLFNDVLATINFRVGAVALQINHLAWRLHDQSDVTKMEPEKPLPSGRG